MIDKSEGFTAQSIVSISPAALALAKTFAATAGARNGGTHVVSFEWVTSMVEHVPGETDRQLGPCLILGAYRREELSPDLVSSKDGIAFAVRIPAEVWQQSGQRLIDADNERPFGLVLR